MSAWAGYAGAGLVLVVVGAGMLSPILHGKSELAVWFAAGVAWILQSIAFAGMVALRHSGTLFLMSWVAGIGLRLITVGAAAWWFTRARVFPLEPLLLSLVAFLFLLLLLEPIFLRQGLRTS
jgi:hypothetical protein